MELALKMREAFSLTPKEVSRRALDAELAQASYLKEPERETGASERRRTI